VFAPAKHVPASAISMHVPLQGIPFP
jgi:hypothetical protein